MKKRWDEKLLDFNKAIKRLNESIEESKENPNSTTLKDGVIQRFEFTYEICWKILKYYLESEGIEEAKSPKSTFRAAFKMEILEDGELWIDMLNDRNLTSHVYDEEKSIEIYNKIVDCYYAEIVTVANLLNKKVVE